MILLYIIFAIAVFEIGLILTIRHFRKEFQWLITQADECPRLHEKELKKFFKHGYDARLGWVRKPNTKGREKGRYGGTTYAIDSKGARFNPASRNLKSVIATFGDSYTFCRQVNDDETWQVFLTQKLKRDVLNYGVGNYGADQALLRYEETELPPSVKIAILEFVPETICRINSYWKHYLEFGNTFAFKPRFVLKDQGLTYLPNVMQTEDDFLHLSEKLRRLQKDDYFYRGKFKSLQFRSPYIVSFLRHPMRNTQLLKSLLISKIARGLNRSTSQIANRPFGLVMSYNIKQAHKMYSKRLPSELLRSILLRFKDTASKRGHKPLVMVMPQLIDLKIGKDKKLAYHDFFERLNREIPVLDLSGFILRHRPEELYTEDLYGGHFSKDGNRFIADYLFEKLTELFPSEIITENNLVRHR